MALGIYSEGGAGRPCWWIGSQQPSPGPDGRLGGGEDAAAIRLCPLHQRDRRLRGVGT